MLPLLQSISFILVLLFLTYVTLILIPFLRQKQTGEGDASRFQWHAFIPCRDEGSVIAATIRSARETFPEMHLWVIDDDSDDDTAEIVRQHALSDPFVHLVQRRRPEARTGKGDALNAAYVELGRWLPHDSDRASLIVVVIDADGELAPNALSAVATESVFGDPAVGAAQVAVRMRNCGDRNAFPGRGRLANAFAAWLLRLQDVEFRTVILAMQALRSKTGTVGMGGNGQFTRLSALDVIAEKNATPWHGTLLEDYELGLHVIFEGFENRQVTNTHVSQEAVPSMARLITQRARWAQGNIQCIQYLPRILRSPRFDAAGALEAAYYLLLPLIQIVGGSVFILTLGVQVTGMITDPLIRTEWLGGAWAFAILSLVFGIGPFAIWGFVYKSRCVPTLEWYQALLIGLALWPYQIYVITASVKGLARILRGRNGWAKTRRAADASGSGTIAIEA
jgi:cellulose synthase/poly-beta-1,6-N-acetylglucosamine synthase-like glycosyltransferase